MASDLSPSVSNPMNSLEKFFPKSVTNLTEQERLLLAESFINLPVNQRILASSLVANENGENPAAAEPTQIIGLEQKKNLTALKKELCEAYQKGISLPHDPAKALLYRSEEEKLAENNADNSEQSPPDPDTGHYTDFLYSCMGEFSACRLFKLRLVRVLDLFVPLISNSNIQQGLSTVLHITALIAQIGGLSYGIELLIDTGVIIHAYKKGGTLTNILLKDNRPYRMANAAIWFGINLAALIKQTAGVAFPVPLALSVYLFDVVNCFVKSYLEIKEQKKLLKILKSEPVSEGNKPYYEKCIENIEQKIKTLRCAGMTKVLIAALILAGTALALSFPPSTALFVIGASLALLGSIAEKCAKKYYFSQKPQNSVTFCSFFREAGSNLACKTPQPSHESQVSPALI